MPISKEILDELIKDYKNPEDLLGEQGLLKQLAKALLERAMQAELTHDSALRNTTVRRQRKDRTGAMVRPVKPSNRNTAKSIWRFRATGSRSSSLGSSKSISAALTASTI